MKYLTILLFINTFCLLLFAQSWEKLGTPYYGSIGDLAISYSNHSIMYAVKRYGGNIFKSTDEGDSWQVIGNSNSYTIAVSFINPEYILLNDLKSTDGGLSWMPVNGITNYRKVSFSPNSNSIVYAIKDDLMRSTDFGENWEIILASNGWNTPHEFFVYPSNPSLLYCITDTAFYRSNDYGTTWEYTKFSNYNTYYYLNGASLIDDPNLIVITKSSVGDSIYVSTDAGINFTSYNSQLPIQNIEIDEINNNLIYGSNSYELYISTDWGQSWEYRSLFNTSIYKLLTNYDGELYICSRLGLLRSSDSGINCISIGCEPSQLDERNIIIYKNSNNIYYSNNSALYKKTDAGQGWIVRLPLDDNQSDRIFCIYDADFNKVLAITEDNRLVLSNDGGKSWIEKYESTNSSLTGVYLSKFNEDIIFLTTSDGLLKTTNNSTSWMFRNTPTRIRKFFVSEYDLNYCYMLDWGRFNLYVSSDMGDNWQLTNITHTYGLNNLTFSPYAQELYLTQGPYSENFFKSSDEGNSWEQIVANEDIRYIIFDTTNSQAMFSINYDHLGIPLLFSLDGGQNWNDISNQLPTGIEIIYNGVFNEVGDLYLISDNGMYKGIPDITSVNNLRNSFPNTFHLEQNFPNPFNSSTIIKYHIPELSFVTLKVYDILGNEITTLVNDFIEPGIHTIDFGSESFSSGIYYYQLTTEYFRSVRKMLLLK